MRLYFVLILCFTTLDQISKAWAKEFLALKPFGYDILPIFKLYLSHNTGVSFSLFSGNSSTAKWALIGISCLLCLLLFVWLKQAKSQTARLGISLVIGGAVGNIIDRLLQGAVTDFIALYYNAYSFPIFNMADIFIFCGVILILCEDIFAKKS